MAERLVDRIRTRVNEIRVSGVIPVIRTRTEELVSQVRERVEGGVLTRETTSTSTSTTVSKKKMRGL